MLIYAFDHAYEFTPGTINGLRTRTDSIVSPILNKQATAMQVTDGRDKIRWQSHTNQCSIKKRIFDAGITIHFGIEIFRWQTF